MARSLDLRLELSHVTPRVWRVLRVPANLRLDDLHYAIQAVMGWNDFHPHLFEVGDAEYGPAPDDSDEEEDDETFKEPSAWAGEDRESDDRSGAQPRARAGSPTSTTSPRTGASGSPSTPKQKPTRPPTSSASQANTADRSRNHESWVPSVLKRRTIACERRGDRARHPSGRRVARATPDQHLLAELTLAVLMLGSRPTRHGTHEAWKQFRAEVLDSLHEAGLVDHDPAAESSDADRRRRRARAAPAAKAAKALANAATQAQILLSRRSARAEVAGTEVGGQLPRAWTEVAGDGGRRDNIDTMAVAALPPGPRVPLMGTLVGPGRDPLQLLTRFAREYGDVTFFRLGGERCFLVNHPAVHPRCAGDASAQLHQEPRPRAREKAAGGRVADQRGRASFAAATAHSARLPPRTDCRLCAVMVADAARMRERWHDGESIDIAKETDARDVRHRRQDALRHRRRLQRRMKSATRSPRSSRRSG